jgi:hypothetical protein
MSDLARFTPVGPRHCQKWRRTRPTLARAELYARPRRDLDGGFGALVTPAG